MAVLVVPPDVYLTEERIIFAYVPEANPPMPTGAYDTCTFCWSPPAVGTFKLRPVMSATPETGAAHFEATQTFVTVAPESESDTVNFSSLMVAAALVAMKLNVACDAFAAPAVPAAIYWVDVVVDATRVGGLVTVPVLKLTVCPVWMPFESESEILLLTPMLATVSLVTTAEINEDEPTLA